MKNDRHVIDNTCHSTTETTQQTLWYYEIIL